MVTSVLAHSDVFTPIFIIIHTLLVRAKNAPLSSRCESAVFGGVLHASAACAGDADPWRRDTYPCAGYGPTSGGQPI